MGPLFSHAYLSLILFTAFTAKATHSAQVILSSSLRLSTIHAYYAGVGRLGCTADPSELADGD